MLIMKDQAAASGSRGASKGRGRGKSQGPEPGASPVRVAAAGRRGSAEAGEVMWPREWGREFLPGLGWVRSRKQGNAVSKRN